MMDVYGMRSEADATSLICESDRVTAACGLDAEAIPEVVRVGGRA